MTDPFFCKRFERPEACWPCAVERRREQWPEVQSTAEAFREYAQDAGIDVGAVVDAVLDRLNPNDSGPNPRERILYRDPESAP